MKKPVNFLYENFKVMKKNSLESWPFGFWSNQFIFPIDIFTILRFFVISWDFMVSETLEVVYE